MLEWNFYLDVKRFQTSAGVTEAAPVSSHHRSRSNWITPGGRRGADSELPRLFNFICYQYIVSMGFPLSSIPQETRMPKKQNKKTPTQSGFACLVLQKRETRILSYLNQDTSWSSNLTLGLSKIMMANLLLSFYRTVCFSSPHSWTLLSMGGFGISFLF